MLDPVGLGLGGLVIRVWWFGFLSSSRSDGMAGRSSVVSKHFGDNILILIPSPRGVAIGYPHVNVDCWHIYSFRGDVAIYEVPSEARAHYLVAIVIFVEVHAYFWTLRTSQRSRPALPPSSGTVIALLYA